MYSGEGDASSLDIFPGGVGCILAYRLTRVVLSARKTVECMHLGVVDAGSRVEALRSVERLHISRALRRKTADMMDSAEQVYGRALVGRSGPGHDYVTRRFDGSLRRLAPCFLQRCRRKSPSLSGGRLQCRGTTRPGQSLTAQASRSQDFPGT